MPSYLWTECPQQLVKTRGNFQAITYSSFRRATADSCQPLPISGMPELDCHEIVVAPRHTGGLGLINASHMAMTLLGQNIAGLLLSTEPTDQFWAALQEHMWREYKAIPAHLILRRGVPWRLMNSILTAQKSFMHRVVYTLCQLQLSVSPNWDELTVPELLSLPFYNNMFGFTWPDVSTTTVCAWERNGPRKGDLLWYNP
ncbi:uncharacterized protein UDID_17237 [Ustilago sp. UG-2017a]|nr:uncharacterized protein UDID_17237 [Ustilago sp. UG-2017a]